MGGAPGDVAAADSVRPADPPPAPAHLLPARLAAASVAFTLVGLVLYLHNRRVAGTEHFFDPVMPVVALAFAPVGAFVASRRPRNPVGWLWLGTGVVGVAFAAEQYAVHALVAAPGSLPAGEWMAWLGSFLWLPGYLPLWTLVPLLCLDGRPPSPRWAPLLWTVAALIGVATLGVALVPENVGSPAVRNPLGTDGVPDLGGRLQALIVLVAAPACAVALLLRYRAQARPRRAQLRLLVLAAALAGVVPFTAAVAALLSGTSVPLGLYRAAGLLTLLALPVMTMVAITRNGFYDIEVDVDTLVNRMAVYGCLIAVGSGVYLSVVALAMLLASGPVGLAPSLGALVAAGVAAAAARGPVEQRVERLLFRQRKYDYRVLSALGDCVQSSMGPDAVLPAIVETVGSGLKLPYVAIAVGQGDEVIASAAYGQRSGDAVVLPLVHQHETVGRLTVVPRTGRRHFDEADGRLLRDLAGQVGVAAYALCLTADLQRSRERLVTAREEERRRLRRDLHDGLKPALAGVGLGLDAVRNTLGPANPTDELLLRLRCELDNVAADIRRLVHDLRPPALDELGLVGALHQQATRFNLDPGGVQVVVEAPPEVEGLSAAVEVAAYRIALEALENVRKHAEARRCEVVLSTADGYLELEVNDDGAGIGDGRDHGVGLLAMRERAAELGGAFQVETGPGGTTVRVSLPVTGR